MPATRTESDHRIGQPKPSGPLPNRGIFPPEIHDMPQKSGLLSHLAKLAKVRVNRASS